MEPGPSPAATFGSMVSRKKARAFKEWMEGQ